MIAVWYLVVSYYHGGTALVPQMSREQCLSNVTFVSTVKFGGYTSRPDRAYCIPGAANGK